MSDRDPSVAMFHKSTGGNVEKSKLISSGQNTTYNEHTNYNLNIGGETQAPVDPDVITFIQTVAQHVVAWTSRNQSSGADGSGPLPQTDTDHTSQSESSPVDVCDMVPPDPSAFPVASIADRYTRSMLECLAGYPLYEPEPFSELSTKYLCNGVNVGDVGLVTEDGAFDFLFNICPSQNSLINPSNLPDGFSLETPEHSKTREIRPILRGTYFSSPTVTKTKSGEFICKGPQGAVLVLPTGAIESGAIKRGWLEELAKRQGVEWYEHAKTRGRSISNGSLYLVTSFTKCTQWGIAVFDRSCDPGQGLKFSSKLSFPRRKSTPKYHWKGSGTSNTRVANSNQTDTPNQCVFLRGYKIMIRKDIFDDVCNNRLRESDTTIPSASSQAESSSSMHRRQRATRIRGGGGTDLISTLLLNWTRAKTPTVMESDAVVLHANFNSSPVHPSDLINDALLSQNPSARVALTHDDVWCDLLRDNFPKLDHTKLMNIAQSYTSTIDDYGCISLEKISDPSCSSSPVRGTEAQFVDHSQGDGDEGDPAISVPLQIPPTFPPLHLLTDNDVWRREARDSASDFSIEPVTVYHSAEEARNEDSYGIPIQIIIPEPPSIDRDVQSGVTGDSIHPDFSIPTMAPIVATGPYSVVLRDEEIRSEGVPSIPSFYGSSNFQTNAAIIRFGDGPFTEVQRNMIRDYIANITVLPGINNIFQKHVLTQYIILLPRAEAVFNDYQTKKKSGPCFEGTRVALLREMADWFTSPAESRMYVLSGLAGIGKSTIAYTIASRAADLNLLGASFFFSRDEADRKNTKKFFTTIAYQLCVYNETFAKAIGDMLKTERGSSATTKDPQEQLQVLIVDPLRSIVQSRFRPILVVVDALDECDEEDEASVLAGLSQLVRDLPAFKVILTTRPQPSLDSFLSSHGGYKIFHLQDIEDKLVHGDIRLYLKYSLSLEQVQTRFPKRQWCASDEEIDCLVRAAGRLFIMASTAVRYILDKSASNPAAQMQRLLRATAQDHTPLKDLDHFYTVILRNVVPANCDNQDIVGRYQSVVGAIIFVSRPLPVHILADLIDVEVEDIHAVLEKLQSVILLGDDDVPQIYHKSFPDYLTDQARCKDPCLRIDPKIGHTQIAIRCFKIMDKHLKRNILGLGDPARFMSNEDGLKEDRVTDEQLQEKIPLQLRYACVYWTNHLEIANIEDTDLMNGLEKFADVHMLYWFEVLSLIGQLDTAHRAIRVVLKLLKSSSYLYQLLSDALRFISKFYKLINRSALHTYYSALPFAPTDSLLYRRYMKQAVHNICGIEGGPEGWDALIANPSHVERVQVIKFSLDSGLFVSCSEESEDYGNQGMLKIWDAATGTPISTILGHMFAVANDFSTVASSQDKIITFYNLNGSPNDIMFTTLSKIQKLALSSECNRVAAGLSDGAVWLWDSRNGGLIHSFDGLEDNEYRSRLQFTSTGTRLAYSSWNSINLRDGISGKFIANLQCGSGHEFEFSGDGSRITSLSYDHGLTLWDIGSGALIGAATDVDDIRIGMGLLAISANGSLLATADYNNNVTLWSDNDGSLAQIDVLDPGMTQLMGFSLDNILAIATISDIKLYNVETRSLISTLPFGGSPTALAFSPDCASLAVGNFDGGVYLCDIRGIDTSSPPSKEATRVTALALSRDCSRLACVFIDGTVELWETSPTKRRVASHQAHTNLVRALGFDPVGELFASGSDDWTIHLWNGGDGSLHGTLTAPSGVRAVALSNTVLVAAWNGGVTLWSIDTLNLIYTFEKPGDIASTVSIAEDSAIIAVVFNHTCVSLFDILNHTTFATLNLPISISTMTFLPDNSQLVAQSSTGTFLSIDLLNKHIIEGPILEELIQLPDTAHWDGVPIWHSRDKDQHYFSALFSQHKSPVPILWIPREIPVAVWTQGSSMMALGCEDGRVILIRLPTSYVV